jgi:molybdenum-dependent DNA-binding transcriptional regulator ModE
VKVIVCPHCGGTVEINGLGRRPLNIGVIKICDALRLQGNVREAAKSLGCSCAFVYKILKTNGLTHSEVLNKNATKDMTLLKNRGLNGRRQE